MFPDFPPEKGIKARPPIVGVNVSPSTHHVRSHKKNTPSKSCGVKDVYRSYSLVS